METFGKNRSPFALPLYPLSEGKALVLFAALYVCGALVWANLPVATAGEIRERWGILVVVLLPATLVVFRMLSRLLRAAWFAIAIIASLTVVAAGAAVLLPTEAALARVYRTFPFVALGAALAASITACILARPWHRRNISYIILHTGLLVVLLGAFVSLLLREGGFVVLERGTSADAMTLRDFKVTIADESGGTISLRLPFEGVSGRLGRSRVLRAGALRVTALYEPSSGTFGLPRLTLLAADGDAAGSVEVSYGGMPGVLQVGDSSYMVTFAPTRVALPFEMTLDDCRTVLYDGSLIPKEYQADITITSKGDSGKRSETLRVNHPVAEGPYDIYLSDISPDGSVTLQVSRDPGARVVFGAGVLVIAGLVMGFVARMRRARHQGKSDEN